MSLHQQHLTSFPSTHTLLLSISTAVLLASILPAPAPSPPSKAMGNKSVKPTSAAAAQATVDDAIATHPVLIFSKSYCPYCTSAKADIAAAGAAVAAFTPAKVFELDRMGSDGPAIQAYLHRRTGRRTVPNVFIGGEPVGGGDEIAGFARRGVLKQMLTQAPDRLAAVAADAQRAQGEGKEETTEKGSGQEPEREDATEDVKKGDVGNEPDSRGAPEIVDDAINHFPVTVFSKSYCPFCVSAKKHIDAVKQEGVHGFDGPKVFELNHMGTLGAEIQAYLAEKTGRRTVPNVFIGGVSVGGGDDVAALAASGGLKGAIEKAVAAQGSGVDAAAETGASGAAVPEPATKEIVFGAGCFWGVELAFQRVVGVVGTEVGYSNGKLPRVTYEAVCSGLTGSAEVVRVTYDPSVVSLKQLLQLWEERHDPTSKNKQGNDVGTQYRSAVFYYDDEQAAEINAWKEEASKRLSKPIVSEITKVHNYCPAEDYHQKYLEKKGQTAEKGATARIRCYG